MNPKEIQEWLVSHYGHEVMTPGLQRVESILQNDILELAHPYIVTVAGTNGKGETCLSLAYMLKSSKVPYVMWTSPHILSICERFKSHDGEIDSRELWKRIGSMHEKVKSSEIKLSYYEFLWAVFVRWAIDLKVKVWILEVGLGGRLDAVNMLNANLVLLTSISRDHQEILGARFELILKEKLGVMRERAKLFSALELQYLRTKTKTLAKQYHWSWRDYFIEDKGASESNFSLRNQKLADWAYQEILDFFHLKYQKIDLPGIFPGRGEKWSYKGHDLTFFGSHNVDGIRKLIHFLSDASYNLNEKRWDKVWVAFSNRDEKDLLSMIKILKNTTWYDQVCFCSFNHPKAWNTKKLRLKDTSAGDISIYSWIEELKKLDEINDQKILVLGSYYFVAEVQSTLSSYPNITKY